MFIKRRTRLIPSILIFLLFACQGICKINFSFDASKTTKVAYSCHETSPENKNDSNKDDEKKTSRSCCVDWIAAKETQQKIKTNLPMPVLILTQVDFFESQPVHEIVENKPPPLSVPLFLSHQQFLI